MDKAFTANYTCCLRHLHNCRCCNNAPNMLCRESEVAHVLQCGTVTHIHQLGWYASGIARRWA